MSKVCVVRTCCMTVANHVTSSPRTTVTRSKSIVELRSRPRLTGYFVSLSGNVGVLLLCEVAVKPWLELNDAHYDAGNAVKNAKKL